MVEEALKAALKDFTAMRAAEGANLKADVLGKLDTLEQFRLSIAEHAPSVPVRSGSHAQASGGGRPAFLRMMNASSGKWPCLRTSATFPRKSPAFPHI
ncbi:MAG: hypothetical protein ACLT8E_01825 [Akkermansia sp.]